MAGDSEDSGEAYVVDVVAGLLAVGSVLAVAGERTVYDARVYLAYHVVVEPEPAHDAGAKPLDQHVVVLDELLEYLFTAFVLEVELHAFLVAVDGEEVDAFLVDLRREPPHVVAAERVFHFEHFGSHIRQQHSAVSAGEQAREIQHLQSFERVWHWRILSTWFPFRRAFAV